jgi:hypothetical protein
MVEAAWPERGFTEVENGYSHSMSTSVFLKLKDGRAIPFGSSGDAVAAARMKSDLEDWLEHGSTLTVANAKGELEDITPRRVVAIDVIASTTDREP